MFEHGVRAWSASAKRENISSLILLLQRTRSCHLHNSHPCHSFVSLMRNNTTRIFDLQYSNINARTQVRLVQLKHPDLLGPGERGKITIAVKNISNSPYGQPFMSGSLLGAVRVEFHLSGYIVVESHESADNSVELVAAGFTQEKDAGVAASDGIAEDFVCALNFASLAPGETKSVTLHIRMNDESVAASYVAFERCLRARSARI